MKQNKKHTFFIPVMGIGYSIDTPVKVGHFGISSVISLVDDILIDKMRAHYSHLLNLPFREIPAKAVDSRAERIREYLNLVDSMVRQKLQEMRSAIQERREDIRKYVAMLPDTKDLKADLETMLENSAAVEKLHSWLREHLEAGSIDVNIMTKADGQKYRNGELLPPEYNEAHAALRGFATSKLRGSLVLSAGMNPRLYSYIEQFEDFYPDVSGHIRKKIILKVSDYRSALIQGKFLAKKGLWVSEYRIESGLNCGGHAFATDGYLMGPILEEFKSKRYALVEELFSMYSKALAAKNKKQPDSAPETRITAQGGVGTHEEHQFLLEHYSLDAVGWGTPFLNVPEATNVDPYTQQLLLNAREEDLYLSGISPLDVPFNSLRGNSKDAEREQWIAEGHPGAPCTHKHVELDTETTGKPICKASRQYQTLKIKELKQQNLPEDEYRKQFDRIVEKTCICVGLGTPALLVNELETRLEGPAVSVCPGPNMAYFSKIVSLRDMVDHIYGRSNIIERTDRPHMFIKELALYAEYLKNKFAELHDEYSENQEKYLHRFRDNLHQGISYYKELFSRTGQYFQTMKEDIFTELKRIENYLYELKA